MDYAEKALNFWRKSYPEAEGLYVESIGENDTYIIVTLSTPYIDELGDGFFGGEFSSPDSDVYCEFLYDRTTGEFIDIWNNSKPI